jgi:hypothetical protein
VSPHPQSAFEVHDTAAHDPPVVPIAVGVQVHPMIALHVTSVTCVHDTSGVPVHTGTQ